MLKLKNLIRVTGAARTAGRLVVAGVALASLMGVEPALAQVTRVVTANFAPLTDNTSPDKKGLLYDVVAEMMKLQKVNKPIEFTSWGEAVAITEKEPGTLTFPMTQTAERKDKFLWVAKIFDMPRSFASRPGAAPVNTIEEAKALKAVGTTAASASLGFLKSKGLANIVEFPTSLELMKALLDAKVDTTYQPNPFAKADWKAAGGQGALVLGTTQETSAAYLAANKNSKLNPEDWQGALQVMEQEGAFDALLEKYGMK